MTHDLRRAIALAIAIGALPFAASAQPAPAADVAPGETPAVQWVFQLGYDFGFEEALEVTFDDGSEQTLNFNEGVSFGVGAAFLPLAGGRFNTQATIGVEYAGIKASNGSARWLAYPLELVEFVNLAPVRFGAGISYLIAPSVKGEDFLADVDAEFENSLGLLLVADWVWPLTGSPRGSKVTAGIRYEAQKLTLKDADLEVDANAFGIVGGFTY